MIIYVEFMGYILVNIKFLLQFKMYQFHQLIDYFFK